MQRSWKPTVWALLALLSVTNSAHAEPDTFSSKGRLLVQVEAPSRIWLDARFDKDGHVQALAPVNAAQQPASLWALLRQRLQGARIEPPQKDGQAADFHTGLWIQLEPQAAGDVAAEPRIQTLAPAPLPVKLAWLRAPREIETLPGWEGAVTVRCQVSVQGECQDIEVEALPGVPESVRRWARLSAKDWRFQPQALNDQAVEGLFVQSVRLRTRDDLPPESFGKYIR